LAVDPKKPIEEADHFLARESCIYRMEMCIRG